MKKICFLTMMGLMSWILMLTPSMAQKSGKNAQAGSSPAYACEEDVIEIMFSWESRVRMRNETLVDLATNALQGTDQILNELAWHQWIRLTDVSETLVDSWETNGELNTGEDLYNLNNVYRLRIPKGHDIWEISARLEALQGVHLARPVPKPVVPPSLPPPPGSYQSQQGYLNPASYNPSGVDAIYAWTQTGGTGTGITICDLEYSWNYNHADITKAIGSQINPNPITDPFNNTNHGTAVIGELVANNNGWGTTGICYGASLKTCGTNYAAGGGWNVPGAMTYAIASLSAGDIILLEQQWEYTSGLQNYIPIEWWLNYSNSAQTYNAVYAAIVTAVANGIHVVEAGGNGNVNTGSLTWYGDSGAIIVGAGGATTTNDRQRLSFSSYGPRFNLQGWGENIVTTGGSYYGPDLYSAEGPNYYYTNTFNGTSGASPIVAASIACTEGYYLANISSVPPTPAFMRSHLATYGTAQVYGPSGNIGPRPNIQAAIQNFPPPQLNYDWGDTPDPPYPTLTTNNGAFHLMDGVTYLGYSVDAENNGQPNVNATGDDNDGNNDDDGVIFTSQLIPGQNANVQVIASAAGVLNAWIDFNQMNNWSDAGEFIFQNIPLNQGVNNLSFFVPPNALTGYTYARFRYNTYGGILFYGNGQNGEVEDYQVFIGGGGQDELDWGDAPDGPYPTLNSSNGARHQIVTGVMLGISIDSEPNGQPDPQCLGDDNDLMYPPPNDDEDGVVFQGTFIPGQPANINVTVSVQGYLNAWFDFNNNGSWLDPGEHIFPDILIPAGLNPLVILIPPAALPGQTYARFRFSTVQGLSFTGFAPDGEVEDYLVTIGLQPEEFDWGDAPDGPYPTLGASNGAHHRIVPGFMLGSSIDPEPDGQPEPMALGDDNDIFYPPVNDDEDGVIFTSSLIPGQSATVNITASAMGILNAWIDFNLNGSWADSGEHIFLDMMLNPGINSLSFPVPPSATVSQTFARFRFSNMMGLTYTGMAPDGEVEDYTVNIDPQPEEFDWGDAPDFPYPTKAANNGARHRIMPGFMLGSSIDPEPDGQPEPMALGDDNDIFYPPVNDDEDGVVFTSPLISAQIATVNITASVNGLLNAWIDFNINGFWGDPGEQIFFDIILNPGLNTLSFPVPATATAGISFARFRFSSMPGLTFTGMAPDGEVEDYAVNIEPQPEEFDWGDAPDGPYPTLGASNGAHHRIVPGFMLGNSIDPEPDGQPEPMAMGDDNDILYPPANDDEDGVVFTSPLISAQIATVNISASVNGLLNAWIDFNINGFWGDPGEQIFFDIMLNPGLNTLSFPVPATATAGISFARFRFSSMLGLSCIGMAPDGEVEDYAINIEPQPEEFDWGDAPDGPYPTLGASNGAHHRIVPGFMLGNSIDPEPDGQPEPMAMGDDNDILYPPANDDEDGVVFTSPLISAQIATVNISASVNGLLNAWIDFNINGFWGDPGEQIFFDIMLNPGLNTLSFPVPATATAGISFARFRFSSMPGLTFTGMAPDGEVEDYAVNIEPQSEEFDWGDAPDGPYPTLGVNNGARHLLDGVTFLGQMVDAEADGQPHPNALGDDNNNAMDEDGVQFNWPLLKGSPVMITITASTSGLLNGWIDFNRDGTWAQPNEQVFVDFFISSGTHQLNFIVPPTAQAGISFARFRFSNQPGLSYTGLAFNGEVEDYEVMIVGNPELKWQQLPDAGRPGLHAHDYINSAGNNEWITLADDWLCNGGRVTDIHWWGNYELNAAQQEIKGAGISHFHLSIHAHNPGGNCLPVEPEVWGIDVPFNSITEQFTGSLNNELSPIYLYEFTLPVPFQQVPGTRYWLDITAVSVNPNQNPHWRWQEAIRGNLPILCSAADKISPVPGSWSTIFWPATGLFNDMAFAITNVPDKALNLKFFLEGLYAGAGTMNKAQDASGNHFASDTADVVTIELHDATSYSIIVHSMNNVAVNTNGQATIGTVPYTMTGSYYITIKHRNSIETVSANPVSFAGNSISYDFSTAASQAYGSNQKGIGGTYVIYGGDVNQDGVIDTADMTPIDNDSANYASGYLDTDVNGDGVIDTADMTIVDNNAAAYVGVVTP
jgi:hypothetical protein